MNRRAARPACCLRRPNHCRTFHRPPYWNSTAVSPLVRRGRNYTLGLFVCLNDLWAHAKITTARAHYLHNSRRVHDEKERHTLLCLLHIHTYILWTCRARSRCACQSREPSSFGCWWRVPESSAVFLRPVRPPPLHTSGPDRRLWSNCWAAPPTKRPAASGGNVTSTWRWCCGSLLVKIYMAMIIITCWWWYMNRWCEKSFVQQSQTISAAARGEKG